MYPYVLEKCYKRSYPFSKAFACKARETAATSKMTRTIHACALENLVKKYKITSLLILPLYDQINSLCFNHINQEVKTQISLFFWHTYFTKSYFRHHKGSKEVIGNQSTMGRARTACLMQMLAYWGRVIYYQVWMGRWMSGTFSFDSPRFFRPCLPPPQSHQIFFRPPPPPPPR